MKVKKPVAVEPHQASIPATQNPRLEKAESFTEAAKAVEALAALPDLSPSDLGNITRAVTALLESAR